jgi:hypothetical protein
MTKHITAALLAALFAAQACAADSAVNVYTLQIWESQSRQGIARVIGPMTQAQCVYMTDKLQHTPFAVTSTEQMPLVVPPEMRLLSLQCANQGNLNWWFAAYGCSAYHSATVPKHPEAHVWLYSCVMVQ